ncbi:MAG: metallophosphoesterase [Planctomycetes bacterium]|nr:metallophosphoesterase [Planctomycetota bacterium]
MTGDVRLGNGWGNVAVAVLATGALLPFGCGGLPGVPLANESTIPVDTDRFELVARFVHISDAQIVDEESPGRLTAAAAFATTAWRPHEAYATQLLDGMIRAINKQHVAVHTIDFVVHTGDALDNAQLNELEWFVSVFDGGTIDPSSGGDDRSSDELPDASMDPHHPFEAQGLYRRGVHGDEPTIPWYSVFGNHDRFAAGVFPIVSNLFGSRRAPLPLGNRIGLFLPVNLDPTGSLSWGPITPANPGPPPLINFPTLVSPNAARRFITDRDFVNAHVASVGEPKGHGFDPRRPDRTWYTAVPVAGVRLITLNTSDPAKTKPGLVYSEGAVSLAQLFFLAGELKSAEERGEIVIVATHHPSDTFAGTYGSALMPNTFREALRRSPNVKLHIAGHSHRNAVTDRGGYVEVETCSILDAPQQGRVIEIWRDGADVELRYWMFSHLDDFDPPTEKRSPLFDDPLRPMREVAAGLAEEHRSSGSIP